MACAVSEITTLCCLFPIRIADYKAEYEKVIDLNRGWRVIFPLLPQ